MLRGELEWGALLPRAPRPLARARSAACLACLALGCASLAPAPAAAQRLLEIPFVPTPQIVVDEMLRIAGVAPGDVVMDLGSGDGRIVITAAKKFGARGIGVELDEHLIFQSEEAARRAGVEGQVEFLEQDLFRADLRRATVITMYLLPAVMSKLKRQLLELRPGTRLVAHDFDFGDWKPDRRSTIRKNVFLWIVPARVAGRWEARLPILPIERRLEIAFQQRYQELEATARLNGVPTQVWEAKIEGERLSFVVVDATDPDNEASLYFEGRVAGDRIDGEIARGVGSARTLHRWSAVRTGR